jgi:hypothetical protein
MPYDNYCLAINLLLAWELIICWIVSDTNWSRGGTSVWAGIVLEEQFVALQVS